MVHVCGLAVLLLLSVWWEAHAIDDTDNLLQDCVDDPHWSSHGVMCKDITSPKVCPYVFGAEEKCCKCMKTSTSTTTSSTTTSTSSTTTTSTTCLDDDGALSKSTGLICKDLTKKLCPVIPDAGLFCCMCPTPHRKCDLSTGTVLKTLTGHGHWVSAVSADFNKQRAISGSYDKTLKVWDLSTGKVLKTLTGHGSLVSAVSADFNKQRAISGSYDKTLKVWDLSTGTVLETLTGHGYSVSAVSADFKKQRAISGSEDTTLKVWRLCRDAELNATSSEAGLRERTSNMLKLGTSTPDHESEEPQSNKMAEHQASGAVNIMGSTLKLAGSDGISGPLIALAALAAVIMLASVLAFRNRRTVTPPSEALG